MWQDIFVQEFFFKTARSGGKGGQHVNKVETLAEALWHIGSSALFSPGQKALLYDRLKNRINKDGYLVVRSSTARSQLANKEAALKKMQALISESLIRRKKRIPTRLSQAVKEKRLETKRRDAIKKQRRKRYPDSGDSE